MGAHLRTQQCIALEHVVCHVIGIGPYAHFRVVRKVRKAVSVTRITTRWIAGSRDRDAMIVRTGVRAGVRQNRENPAISLTVVLDNGIAVVGVLAPAEVAEP